MIGFFLLSLPVFGVVGFSWASARWGLSGKPALDALGAFSFRFALPALVLRLVAGQPIREAVEARFYAGYLAAGLCVFAIALLAARATSAASAAGSAGLATTATVSNLGFFGPPLMLAFFGERGAGPLAMAILAEVTVLLSPGGILMGAGREIRILPAILRGTVRNPVIAAVLAGALLSMADIELPEAPTRFLAFLGSSAGPTALFALGGGIALQAPDRRVLLTAGAVLGVKLVAYPLTVWLALSLLGLDAFWIRTGVFLGSLPSAGNIYILAYQSEAAPETVSTAILLSTLASIATLPFTAWLMST